MPPQVRLRYSTIMNYVSLMYRVLVALGFTIIVARRLSISEFGLWGIILSLAGMLAAPTRLWSFWAQRFHARGWREAASTGLVVTLSYLVPAFLVYIFASMLETRVIGWGFDYLIMAIPIILLQPSMNYLSSLVAVTKPELVAYTNMINDTLRLIAAYLFVAKLRMGLEGAIYSLELALLVATVYLAISLVRLGALKPAFSYQLVKEWFKAFYIPSLILLVNVFRSSVRMVVSLISGSEVPVAYLNVGFSAERPLLQASRAAVPALYARSLREKRREDVEETLRLYIFFSGFLFATFISLSRTIASLYNPRYVDAHLIIPLVALYAFLGGLANIYGTALRGAEKVDVEGIPRHSRLLSSRLFKVPLAWLVAMTASYAMFIVPVLLYVKDPIAIAFLVATSLIIGTAALLAYLWYETRSFIPHSFPLREAIAVAVAALIVATYYIVSGTAALEITSFWSQAPLLMLHLLVGIIVYAAAMYALSPWVRKLTGDALTYLEGLFSATKRR